MTDNASQNEYRSDPSVARFERESPVVDRFESLSGISREELDAELPESPLVREVPPHTDREAMARGPSHAGARRPRRTLYLLVATLAVAGAAFLLLRLMSDVVTNPAVAWMEVDSNLPGLRINAATRGSDPAVIDAPDGGTAGLVALDSAWSVLHGARRTWLGLFPRYDAQQVAHASELFRQASRYGLVDTATRGEAVYGTALTAWLSGDIELAIAALREPAVSYTEASDRAEQMLRALSAVYDDP